MALFLVFSVRFHSEDPAEIFPPILQVNSGDSNRRLQEGLAGSNTEAW